MSKEQTKELLKVAHDRLKQVCGELDHFLNHVSVPELLREAEDAGEETKNYLCEFLRDLRLLSVLCEASREKASLVLRRSRFREDWAEKVLSEIMHSCVYAFYFPKNEVYEEDGRYSYTGQEAIKFRRTPPTKLRDLVLSLSRTFECLREELDYYETDYQTRVRMSLGMELPGNG
ncbi:DUF3907 family protein [Staphylospora marina]|uniref:DUF3907 family protein n=1 Tax=Staphylospora marina TaxID=2490858 RepID=UPI000F5BAD03|nr:DUF3907 family protein [Staphylospora marina]